MLDRRRVAATCINFLREDFPVAASVLLGVGGEN